MPASLIAKAKNRWHQAFTKIYYARRFLLQILAEKKQKTTLPLRSYSALDNELDPELFKIDQNSLIALDLDKLHQLGGVEGVASGLQTSRERGIPGDLEDVVRRREAFGSNTVEKPPRKSLWKFVIEAAKIENNLILLVCAVLSLASGIKADGLTNGWIDGGSILIGVFIVIAVSAVTDFRQEAQFDKVVSEISNNLRIDVIRNGRRRPISILEIVVGDVVCLKCGDRVPADGVVIEEHSLRVVVEESSDKEEEEEEELKFPGVVFLISGTKVAGGCAKMLVTSVGANTKGKMMNSIDLDNSEQTPTQARLEKLTSNIQWVALAVTFLLLLFLLFRYFSGNMKKADGNPMFDGSENFYVIVRDVVYIVSSAVTMVDVAVPEGLELAVKINLAYSMTKMMADQTMVRKLSACETMGLATTICTDKTGILTMNQMEVTMFWLGQETIGENACTCIASSVVELIRQGVALNTTGSVYKRPAADSGSEYEFSGSPTEKALLSWAVRDLKMDMEELQRSCAILHVEAFNSDMKRSGIWMIRKKDNRTTIHVHWKGAAEIILAMCSSYLDASGNLKALDAGERMTFEHIIQSMAARKLRCIAFAHTQVEEDQEYENGSALKQDELTLIGLAGIEDPCRPRARKAVEDCQFSGVDVKMITGDNVFTAKALATECGILRINEKMDGAVVEGKEFRNYSEEERMEKVDKISVMARSSPSDKLLMVQCLKRKGYVVAVTGDGTDDAPSLEEADIGLSFGIHSAHEAKESSDILVLDDNFASVSKVLKWGRCFYTNSQKFIQFQLTINFVSLVINFVATFSTGEAPLSQVQLMWIGLIMDPLSALTLATERPTKELMEKPPPKGRTPPILTRIMWINLLAQALYQILILLILLFNGGLSEEVKNTLFFNIFVFCQVFNKFNIRWLEKTNIFEGLQKDKLFIGIIGIIILIQVVMVEILNAFAGTVPLDLGQWGACLGIAAASWIIGWVFRWIQHPRLFPAFSRFLYLDRLQVQQVYSWVLNYLDSMQDTRLFAFFYTIHSYLVRLHTRILRSRLFAFVVGLLLVAYLVYLIVV